MWYTFLMKPSSLLPFVAITCLIGAGCARPSFLSSTKPAPTVSEAARALQEGRVPPSEQTPSGYSLQRAVASDCIGVEGGRATGGDLLRTLANETEYARIKAAEPLTLLTPTSAKILLERVEASAPSSSRFLVNSVCQLNKDVAVVTATVWPKETPTWSLDRDGNAIIPEALRMASTTVIVATGKAIHVFDGVRAWGMGGAPGGDARPCSAKLTATTVSWDCGEGTEWDVKKNAPTGFEQRRTYRLPLKGGRVTSTGYKKKL